MRAGPQRHRVWLDVPQTSQNDVGEEIVAWLPFAEVWASVEPLRGKEQLIASQVLAQTDTRVRIRWSPNLDQVTEKWRARKQGTVYDIVSVVHVADAQRMIELQCQSGTNDG